MSAATIPNPAILFERAFPAITTTQLVRYAGASDDYNRIHYDQAYAVDEAGLGGVIAHGMLTLALMGSALADWAGPASFVRRLDGRFTAPVRPGDVVRVSGAAAEDPDDSEGLRIVLTARVGERTVAEGSAVVVRSA